MARRSPRHAHADANAEARVDALTALPGRAAWNEAIEVERVRRARYRRPVAFLIVEVGAPDVAGAGSTPADADGDADADAAMVAAANLLRRSLRDADFVARIGSRTFGILMPETPPAAIEVVVERITEAADAWRGTDEESRMRLAVASAVPGPFDDVREALRLAHQEARAVLERA